MKQSVREENLCEEEEIGREKPETIEFKINKDGCPKR